VDQRVVTVDAEGNIQGDTSHLDPAILAQLQTPEAQARIREMYLEHHEGGGRPPRERSGRRESRTAARITEGQRDLRSLRPPTMSRKEWRQIANKQKSVWRKAARKQQRSAA
jgi:hypothetical protein